MKTIKLELPVEYISVIQQSLDAVVKGGGIQNARVIIPIYDSIEAQVKPQLVEQPPVKP